MTTGNGVALVYRPGRETPKERHDCDPEFGRQLIINPADVLDALANLDGEKGNT